ncbi:hypothetical protein CLSAP_40500 [Clostridium saccharoperbutylacetonicum]|nr:hypothetical protein CLSAP_40500 [Clostridium saccharoperbutylacetonicum]NSB32603.1 hypothetical protein [Clostridium saccharoperbutylacetonicum]
MGKPLSILRISSGIIKYIGKGDGIMCLKMKQPKTSMLTG